MINRTFSLPDELNKSLHSLISRGGISRFVSECIAIGLEGKKKALSDEYECAMRCSGQISASDMECTLQDGLGEHNDW